MAVVLTIIVLLTAALSSVALITLRDREINSRLTELTRDARDIAYLAAQSTTVSPFIGTSVTQNYLERKAAEVNQEYGAYILVVDRRGRVMDNIRAAYQEDPKFVASLDSAELNGALSRVLGGEEFAIRSGAGGETTFTVGVPFVRNGTVLGAVLIQTKAQVIEDGVAELLRPIVAVWLMAMAASALALFLLVRRVLRPLRQLTAAAGGMAEGDFTVRVAPKDTVPETAELASAFNTMADKLGELERSRREFVANVSHELRSPITSIRGFVEGMEDGTIPAEEHEKYLAIVGGEVRRLSKLIGDLLALSRLERDDAALDQRDFDVCELLCRAIVPRVDELERRHMEIVCDFREDPCMVHADSDRIEQVAVNLLDNAIRFTPDGGQITLTAERSGETCTITVADNGAGILPEDRPHVFERFFTADRAHTSGKGTGLGLSICQRILDMHGQSIRLLDTQEGAAFAFTLAAAKQEK